MNVWQRFQQLQQRRKGRRQDKLDEQGMRQQWFLLAGKGNSAAYPQPQQLNPIYPPNDCFWADPFLWSKDGRYFIFFEDFPYATWRGIISVIEIDEQGKQISEPRPVLEEAYHLSYPFLFEYDGQLYMMPEKCSQKRVDIYRCDEFPHRWSQVSTLIDNLKIVDSTLFEHDGKWWLFAAAKQGRVRINESLFAFYADSPLSNTWTPHPLNPLVRDLTRGRPAGRICHNSQGQLLRPAQDCLRRYGYGVHLQEITQLTTTAYQEQTVWSGLAPNINNTWRAMHHLDYHNDMMVMDAQRLLPMMELVI
ncbi:MAG: hypothetical protein IPL02_06830 [Moraxellaceae bacterium]|nr:hypothetical protein [Moraxellaceae bacterium]